MLTVESKQQYKSAIVGAAPSQVVVVDYLKPSCAGCRRLAPKLKQIVGQNPDVLFLKVRCVGCLLGAESA